MNRLTCATAIALMGATTAAVAADLPSRRAPPVYVPPIMATGYNWTGLEFGLTTSYTIPNGQNNQTVPFGGAAPAPGGISLNKSGFDDVGGGVAANYQLRPGSGVVFGVQADVDYFNLHAYEDLFLLNGGKFNFQQRLAYLGTANGRVGYAFDRLLIYATGGFAYGEVHNSVLNEFAGPQYFGTASRISKGYDVGGGIEYAIPPDSFLNKLSVEKILGLDKKLGLDIFDGTLRAEYVHYDLGRETFAVNALNGNPGGYVASTRTEGSLIRVGLGYKFNGLNAPAAPVVARY